MVQSIWVDIHKHTLQYFTKGTWTFRLLLPQKESMCMERTLAGAIFGEEHLL